jgi:hypothetical protein
VMTSSLVEKEIRRSTIGTFFCRPTGKYSGVKLEVAGNLFDGHH